MLVYVQVNFLEIYMYVFGKFYIVKGFIWRKYVLLWFV